MCTGKEGKVETFMQKPATCMTKFKPLKTEYTKKLHGGTTREYRDVQTCRVALVALLRCTFIPRGNMGRHERNPSHSIICI